MPRSRIGVAILAILVAGLARVAPARAQASDPELRPTRGPYITGAVRAGDADATAVELAMPALIVVGLMTRLATLPLIGMAIFIQLFVYPSSWPDHLIWLALLALLLARGPGAISLDAVLARQLDRNGAAMRAGA